MTRLPPTYSDHKLGETDSPRRSSHEVGRERFHFRSELVARHDARHKAHFLGLGGGVLPAGHDHFLESLDTDDAAHPRAGAGRRYDADAYFRKREYSIR
jgi:hypothetical protein